jgi:hypothetical protein
MYHFTFPKLSGDNLNNHPDLLDIVKAGTNFGKRY